MPTLAERKAKLFGNHALLVTPLTPKGDIDEESTKSLVDYVIQHGVHGILPLGSTGEVFALTEAERRKFIEIVCAHTKGRVPVGVGVIDSSSDISAQMAKHAAGVGADYIFTTAPYYHPHGPEGIFRHVKYIADATDLPVMVYDGGAGIELPLPLLKRMADNIPTLACSKLFLSYPAKIGMYEAATGGKLAPWAGQDQLNYQMLLHGAKGMTSAASCVVPREQSDIFENIRDGKIDRARDIFHSVVGPLNSIAFRNVLHFVQCYKRALMWMKVIAHDTCKPMMEPIDDIHSRELRAVLERIGKL